MFAAIPSSVFIHVGIALCKKDGVPAFELVVQSFNYVGSYHCRKESIELEFLIF